MSVWGADAITLDRKGTLPLRSNRMGGPCDVQLKL